MDKKTKVFFIIFFGIIVVVAGISFYKYIILRNYYITIDVPCDPAQEQCFKEECDPESADGCPKDAVNGATYYKLIKKKAYAVPACDPNNPDCPPLACFAGEDCLEILCDEAAAEDYVCSGPEEYRDNQNSFNQNAGSGDSAEENFSTKPINAD